MGILSGLFRLTNHQKLPRLRHHLTNGRKLDDKDETVQLLLEAGLIRDWSHGKRMVKKHHKSPIALYWELSRAARPNWRKRLLNRVIRAFGAIPHDPYREQIKRLEKGDFRNDGPHPYTYRIMPSARGGAGNKKRR